MHGDLMAFNTWGEASDWIDKRKEVGVVFYSWFDGRRYLVRMIDRRTSE